MNGPGSSGAQTSADDKTKIFGGNTYMLLRDDTGEAVAAFPIEAYRFIKADKEVTYWIFNYENSRIAICVDKYKFKEGITAENISEAEYGTYDVFGSVETSNAFEYIELKVKPQVKKPEYEGKKDLKRRVFDVLKGK